MLKEMVSKIDTKISEVENKIKQNNELIAGLNFNIENQSSERTRLLEESKVLSGFLIACKSMSSEFKTYDSEEFSELENEQEGK